ncbi:MAG: ATP-binding cassette domain-containing protein [Chloroflexi bacterium]|nr:ATP-binding cassette domain-containing protein [Chloroflexota bacterium]
MSEYAVVTEKLRRVFGGRAAVDGVDLQVRQGEIYGFLGPNGAGKSTAVRMLTTLLMPTSGTARVADRDVVTESMEVRLRIGAALQDAALDPKQTGIELMRLQGRLYGLSGSDTARRIRELEPLVDIGDAIKDQIGTYSGGMKRRLDLAASLIHNPEVLFLDEPTTGLDPISRSKVWDEVRRINRDLGVTIFLTTQYLEEADALADRIGIITHGVLAAEDTPAALKRTIGADVIVAKVEGDVDMAKRAVQGIESVESVDVYDQEISIRVANGAGFISTVALALNDAAVSVRELTLRTPTLGDVFLSVTGVHIAQDEVVEEEKSA